MIEVAAGRISLLIVTMPPRHGKSELISKYLPAWYVQRFKNKRVILASYEAEFAASWGGKARDVTADTATYFGVSLKDTASNRWGLANFEGGMQTAGVGGPITGKGADLFIIDDPIKNDQEAMSATMRDKTWSWFQSVAMTRLEPHAAMVVVMTRWHEDDLVGRLIQLCQETHQPYTLLNFPAICEDETLPQEQELGRKNGEALWPSRYPEAKLQKIRVTSGLYWWNALYQQRPAPLEGNLVKKAWFRYFSVETHDGHRVYALATPEGVRRILVSDVRVFFTIDLASSTKTLADFTVVSVWGLVPKTLELLWLEAMGVKLEGPDQQELVRKMHAQYKPLMIGCEATAYQLTMVQALLKDGLPAFKLKADKDKVSRFIPAGAYYSNGKIYHHHLAPWLMEAEDQLLHFPKATHDDYVDTVSYAFKMIEYISGGGEMKIEGY